ncbi:MAG TPA: J domain-containing protein [Rectinemataceae bacterium]|nr:J domain-containing protein [Rectinemataceae bacterium]
MNRLLDHLEREGPADLESLKRLYRALCKASHPDRGSSDGGRTFRWLRAEYEEARGILAGRNLPPAAPDRPPPPRRDPEGPPNSRRSAFLDALGQYADFLKALSGDCFASRPATPLVESVVEAAAAYDPELGSLFEEYFEFLGIRLGRMLRYARAVTAFRCLWNALIAFTRWRRRGLHSDSVDCGTWCASIRFDPVFGEPGEDSLGAVELFDRVGRVVLTELGRGR